MNTSLGKTKTNIEGIELYITHSPETSFTVYIDSAKDVFYDELKMILNHCNFKREIMLTRNFNINWDNKTDRKKLEHLADSFSVNQIIQGSTRITNSKTAIDIIFTSKTGWITKIFNLLSGLSDHNFILCARKLIIKHSTRLPKISYNSI